MPEAAPLVSVLLPAFDAQATLGTALRSVARQTETRLECIVVDDGSRDGTARVAQAAAARDPRFRVLRTPHRGLVAALAAGLEVCRGRYVARMDADDCMHRERLRLQVERLERAPSLAGVGARVRLFPRAHLRNGRRDYERWLNGITTPADVRSEAFVECPVAHPTLVLRREVACELGYRDCGWPEDYDLVLRLLARGGELEVLPRRLLAWRDTPGRLSRTGAAYRLERFTACKAAFLAECFLGDVRDYVLWGYGDTGRALRRALACHDRYPSHVVELHPGRLGQRIHGAPVVAPEALAGLRGRRIVASVSGAAPRALIRAALARLGLRELRDFVCAA